MSPSEQIEQNEKAIDIDYDYKNSLALKEQFDIVNISLFQVIASTIALLISLFLIRAKDKLLSEALPAVMNQFAITGMLPLVAMKMPTFPLIYTNIILFIVSSLLNLAFMARTGTQVSLQITIFSLWLVLVYSYRQKRLQPVQIYD